MLEKKIPYWQKLQDPRWQKVRLKVLERDSFTCRICDDDKSTLEVHHLYYVSGREPWEYPLSAFKTVCKECHKVEKMSSSMLIANWERFLEITDTTEDYPNFIKALDNFSSLLDEPPVEVLSALSNAMTCGLIKQSDLIAWRKPVMEDANVR